MKKQTITVLVTVITTILVLFAAFYYLMPTIGARYLHPMIMGGEASAAPDNLDTSTSILTGQKLFRVSYTSNVEPIPLNQIHSWTLHVETADGQAVEGADIIIDGGMPQHGHGLPTSPQITENLGSGDYLVEGMKFQMPGWWELQFNISAGGQSDTATFNLILE